MTAEFKDWTIAYRKRTANRFSRVTNWCGTWSQAVAMAAIFAAMEPELQVFYTSTAAAEESGRVGAEDIGNIMVDSGKRIRIVEKGELPAELIARIPVAALARQRWLDGKPIAEPAQNAPEHVAVTELLTAAAQQPQQTRVWFERHGLHEMPSLTASDILAARAADHELALRCGPRAGMVPQPHPASNCGPLMMTLPVGANCPTCGTLVRS